MSDSSASSSEHRAGAFGASTDEPPASATRQIPTSAPPADSSNGGSKDPEQTMLEQMGGVSGLAYSAVPIVAFVVVNSIAGLMPAIWSAIGVAVALAVVRVVRKEPLQPAISGLIGVAVCSFIAYRSGDAKGFFWLGIWTSLVYGGIFLISILARWPLVGTAWSALNGQGFGWRHQRKAMTGYDLATLTWVVVFGAKFVVQQWLYEADQTGWLAFARIVMGYPLTALAVLVTVWAVRRASKIAELAESADAASTPARSDSSTG